MSLLVREHRNVLTDLGIDRESAVGTYSGQAVTPERAERHSAVWASKSAIAEAFLTLPLEEIRRTEGGVERSTPPPLFYDPAPGVPWESWIWQQVWALAGNGRCYAMVTSTDSRGFPSTLVPVPDETVRWTYHRTTNTWTTHVDNRLEDRWPLGRLWHCPLYVKPGLPMGMSPIVAHAESIGVGLAAQQYGAQFFGDGAHPTSVIKPLVDPGDTGAKKLKRLVMGATRGNREPIILPVGTEWERWQTTPDESQFLDTMRYSGEDVARIFGVPPSKIGIAVSGESVTYTNVADRNSDWRVAGLARYVATLEAYLSRLTPAGNRRQLRFNFKGFLRADQKARFDVYKTAAQIGAISGTPVMFTNEMRADEGLEPADGGDEFTRARSAQPRGPDGT